MYIPQHFAENDPDKLINLVRENPLGALVISTQNGFEANHLPFVLDVHDDTCQLRAHIPRANPLSKSLLTTKSCVVIFQGAQGYISPAWYATKKQHGKVVPTWNYAVAHVHGEAQIHDDADWVLIQLNDLTEQSEGNRIDAWSVSDAPVNYTQQLVKSLVGLSIVVSRIDGKFKASQNQPAENKTSVLAALESEMPDSSLQRMMKSYLR